MKLLNYIVLILIIIGALNWLSWGLAKVDLIALLLGKESMVSKVVYIIMGVCGLYAFSFFGKLGSEGK